MTRATPHQPQASGRGARRGNSRNLASDLVRPGEDWENVADSAERRKIQNRIAQRAYRRNVRERRIELEHLRQQLKDRDEGSATSSACPNGATTASSSKSVVASEEPALPPAASDKVHTVSSRRSEQHFPTARSRTDPRVANSSRRVDERLSTPAAPSSSVWDSMDWAAQELDGSIPSHASARLDIGELTPPWPSPVDSNQDFLHALSPLALTSESNGIVASGSGGDLPALGPPKAGRDDHLKASWTWAGEQTATEGSSITDAAEINHLGSGVQGMTVSSTTPQSKSRLPILHMAVASGKCEILKMLLQEDEAPIDTKDSEGHTPLERAVLQGNAEMVAILLEHGAEIADHVL